MTRLAVAVWPSAGVIAALATLDRPVRPDVTWSAASQWMVKVRPLGHVADAVAERLASTLRDELEGAPAVRCTVGPATRRLDGQWLGAPVEGLDELAAVVFEVTEPIVAVTHPQPFRADIVLARGRVPKELAGQPVSATWTARRLTLVADRSSPHGPRFDDIAVIHLGR